MVGRERNKLSVVGGIRMDNSGLLAKRALTANPRIRPMVKPIAKAPP